MYRFKLKENMGTTAKSIIRSRKRNTDMVAAAAIRRRCGVSLNIKQREGKGSPSRDNVYQDEKYITKFEAL
jgi:hypothetical protein